MNETYPKPIREFVEGLETFHPDAEVSLERGGKTSGVWWIDIAASHIHVVGQWTPANGFGLEEVGDDDDPVYGSLPAERYQTVDLALQRMSELLAEERFSQAS